MVLGTEFRAVPAIGPESGQLLGTECGVARTIGIEGGMVLGTEFGAVPTIGPESGQLLQ